MLRGLDPETGDPVTRRRVPADLPLEGSIGTAGTVKGRSARFWGRRTACSIPGTGIDESRTNHG
jgi:hypothetical protein